MLTAETFAVAARFAAHATAARMETLESRQLLSSAPLTIHVVPTDGGTQLRVESGSRSDSISIVPAKAGLRVSNGDWTRRVVGQFTSVEIRSGRGNDWVKVDPSITIPVSIWGGQGDDTLTGGSGDDNLYGQMGADALFGATGDDTLVNLGDSRSDRATGGTGFDAFWSDDAYSEQIVDASMDEITQSGVQRVDRFQSFLKRRKGVQRLARAGVDLIGEDLPDPAVDDPTVRYRNFSDLPLFASDGPSPDDVSQGAVGDCWYLSSLASMAMTDPDSIRRSVTELGDGTYAVRFASEAGLPVYVRVDADLPVTSWGAMQYAGLGHQDCLWVAIMEKAYATYRYGGVASYADLDGGWMSEAFDDLGYISTAIWDADNGDELLDLIGAHVQAGLAVTIAINQPVRRSPLIGSHAYTVVGVETDSNGVHTLLLRNPWGIDGAGNDGRDDGYVHVTAAQAFGSFWGVISAEIA